MSVAFQRIPADSGRRFVDALFHAVDGNFSQSKKNKNTDPNDVPLTAGAAYYADEKIVDQILKNAGPFKFEVRLWFALLERSNDSPLAVHLQQVRRYGLLRALWFCIRHGGPFLCSAYVCAPGRRHRSSKGGKVKRCTSLYTIRSDVDTTGM